ncbi:hypothetical protein CAPN008_03090 [Capnocytophaga canis]|uniref:hypothetical protein n=1 Tax=Capnocytophaga canis TaxID=1848903 RepID=UPI001AC61BA2|nr:hypothetical protein [Capnocytophaga canis]GIM60259.1 hypothetical protein CAPN008_03090 [Capnocytophaga canis]
MKVQGTKLLNAISFFVMVAISLPASAQSTDKANTLTEQRESEKEMDNYLKETQSLQQQYYPNHNNYFIPIFERAKSAGPEIVAIVKQKIQEALDKYAEVITTPKDQLTVHLMAMELMMPATEFTNHKEVVVIDPERDLDMRQLAANEAVQGVTKHFKDAKERATKENERATKEREKSVQERERATKENERATKENERAIKENEAMQKRVAEAKANLAKIEARGKEVHKQVNTTIDGIEEYMIQLDITLLPKIPQMQDFVKQYMLLCKEIERKPNAVGQKFIDAYQKLQK